MAEESESKSGIVEHTKGKKFGWYGEGKASITASSEFSMTYGVKNEITLAAINDFTASIKTGISVGAAFEAGLSTGMDFKTAFELEEKESVSIHSVQNHVISVGGDIINEARTKAIRTAIKILIIAQAALLLGAAATTIALAAIQTKDENKEVDKKNAENKAQNKKNLLQAKNKHKKEQADYNDAIKGGASPDPEKEKSLAEQAAAIQQAEDDQTNDRQATSTLELEDRLPGYIFSAISAGLYPLVAISTALVLAFDKFKKVHDTNDPAALLSLDETATAFLGIRSTSVPVTGTSGIRLNTSGITLSASDIDLKYQKTGNSPSVIGFEKTPDPMTAPPGALLNLSKSGLIQATGSTIIQKTKKANRFISANHALIVANNGNALPKKNLVFNKDGLMVQADATTSLMLKPGSNISLKAGSGNLTLDNNQSVIGSGGNALTCKQSAVKLAFGNTHLQIDATGISIGGAVTILAPGGPMPTSPAIAKIEANLATALAENARLEGEIELAKGKAMGTEKAIDKLNNQLIKVRSELANLKTAASSKKGKK